MMDRYTQAENSRRLKLLAKYPIDQSTAVLTAWFKTPDRDTCMHELGVGTMRNMKDVYSGVFFPFLGMKEYTIAEKFNTFFRAKPFLRNKTKLIDQLFSYDFSARLPELAIPVYFMSGSYDLTVNHDLNKAYFLQLRAPVKGYYTFDTSAHSPQHEEPERFMQIMREDVLNGKADLADSAY
jgi:pimeloyl-ACP methyl ester carboxylesterase